MWRRRFRQADSPALAALEDRARTPQRHGRVSSQPGFEPATSSLESNSWVESKSRARVCCDFLNLQPLAKSAFASMTTRRPAPHWHNPGTRRVRFRPAPRARLGDQRRRDAGRGVGGAGPRRFSLPVRDASAPHRRAWSYNAVSPMRKRVLGLDWWAVLISLAAALFVKFGVLKSIPW
jgi:hypothetical protein